MNGNPTAEQKRFHDWCRDYGCIVDNSPFPTLHHIKGGKMKLKGVKKPGEWYVLPVCYWWHQAGDNKAAIHINRAEFVRETASTEKEFWIDLMAEYKREFDRYPMANDEYEIIKARA